jgi:phosphonate transport system substrate-binding protein
MAPTIASTSTWSMGSDRGAGRRLLAAAALLLLATAGCGGEEAQPADGAAAAAPPLRFTAIPDQNTTELAEKLAPLARHLAAVLAVPVEYVPAHDYQASVETFRNGDVLLGWFGGLTGVQARHLVPGARAIAQGVEDPAYKSYFIAHRSTGLERADELPLAIRDLRFTFGSESSTSGRLMPEHFLTQATGASPRDFFTHPPGFSGSHDKTIELVESGQVQVGVVNYKVYERRVEEGKTDPEVCRVIWETPEYADYNWTAHPDLETVYGAGFTERLQRALVAIDDPALLAALPRSALIPASNEQYEGIRLVATELGMLR